MRYQLAILVLMSACARDLKPTPTNAVVASVYKAGDGKEYFAACRVVLDSRWSEFEARCGTPLRSIAWAGGGTCHFYRTNAIGIDTESGAQYVAICVKEDEFSAGTMRVARTELIRLVVGLRHIPGVPE